jgi:hypothetical protein
VNGFYFWNIYANLKSYCMGKLLGVEKEARGERDDEGDAPAKEGLVLLILLHQQLEWLPE